MPPPLGVCPRCAAQVPISENTVSGTNVRCPECGTVFATSAAGPSEYAGPIGVAELSSHYSLDLGRIFNRGWTSFIPALGMLIGVTLVGLLISIPVIAIIMLLNLIPIIGSLFGSVVNSAILLPCGLA